MTVFKIILIIAALSSVIYLTIGQLKVLYRRHLKSYKSEINIYLKSQNLTLKTILPPNNLDWKNSPFKKPPRVKLSLFIFQINGVYVTWNDQKYKMIHTNEGKIIWLEIDTTYFKKPVLTFRLGNKMKPIRTKNKQKNENIRYVMGTCPACGFALTENDFECPDCGLNLR